MVPTRKRLEKTISGIRRRSSWIYLIAWIDTTWKDRTLKERTWKHRTWTWTCPWTWTWKTEHERYTVYDLAIAMVPSTTCAAQLTRDAWQVLNCLHQGNTAHVSEAFLLWTRQMFLSLLCAYTTLRNCSFKG